MTSCWNMHAQVGLRVFVTARSLPPGLSHVLECGEGGSWQNGQHQAGSLLKPMRETSAMEKDSAMPIVKSGGYFFRYHPSVSILCQVGETFCCLTHVMLQSLEGSSLSLLPAFLVCPLTVWPDTQTAVEGHGGKCQHHHVAPSRPLTARQRKLRILLIAPGYCLSPAIFK